MKISLLSSLLGSLLSTTLLVSGCKPTPPPTVYGYSPPIPVFKTAGRCSARPSATGSNQLYSCTDIPVTYWDNPATATWSVQTDMSISTIPPTAASFTLIGNIALTQAADVLIWADPSLSAPGDALVAASLPAGTAWTVTLDGTWAPQFDTMTEYPCLGLIVSEGVTSGTSQAYGISAYGNYDANVVSNPMFQIGIDAWTARVGTRGTATDYLAKNNALSAFMGGTGLLHFRLYNDAVHLHYQVGSDGALWVDWSVQTTPASLTHYGITNSATALPGGPYSHGFIYSLVKTNTLPIAQCTITNATNTNPIVLTVSGGCGAVSGDLVAVHGVLGNTAANTTTGNLTVGSFPVAVSGTSITLNGGIGNGAYTSGGTLTVISR